ncbi:hypothetical protein FDP41_001683 [Naegleria fowleri]|uniref:Uncharacterized protein n=1 Tax=Naegleria fowleri TaxID=5763 RepID=A0A6A5C0G8_NAEFO|nr:uncharacterized protein FDP41_001683 [Naegleria fowleri]KAF0979340.1 hypothetical protein FDP41_001683 [Naegleria fowleri]
MSSLCSSSSSSSVDPSLIRFIPPSRLELIGPTPNVANTVEGLSHESCMLGASADHSTPQRAIILHFSRPYLFKFIEMKPHKQFHCCQQQFNGIDVYYKRCLNTPQHQQQQGEEWVEIATVSGANSDDYLYRLDLGEHGIFTQSFKLTRFPRENVSVGMMKCYGMMDESMNHHHHHHHHLSTTMTTCGIVNPMNGYYQQQQQHVGQNNNNTLMSTTTNDSNMFMPHWYNNYNTTHPHLVRSTNVLPTPTPPYSNTTTMPTSTLHPIYPTHNNNNNNNPYINTTTTTITTHGNVLHSVSSQFIPSPPHYHHYPPYQ